MRLTNLATLALLVAAAVRATSPQGLGGEAQQSRPAGSGEGRELDDRLIVHEWGTFTSFSGSDGVRLEFRSLVSDDLPPFVLDRFLQSGWADLGKSTVRTRMRMETPVTYFYTTRERDVRVRVSFPEGLLTEFFPPVAGMEPAFQWGERLPMRNSTLDWGKIHLIPTDRLQAHVDDPALRELLETLLPIRLAPPADEKFHYGQARETDSALVHAHRPKPEGDAASGRPYVPAGDFFEKFLFYRGVGNFDLPLKLTAGNDGTFELVNSGTETVRSLFLVDVGGGPNGLAVRFMKYDQIGAGERLTLVSNTEPATIDALSESVEQSLIAEGLYGKEARAMVKTWRSSWFGERGTRLFYVVPRSTTDTLLPLDISPVPDETVRVLVGRMEIMTREEESRIEGIVRKSAAERADQQKTAQAAGRGAEYAGPAELRSLGRLAEPALTRVRSVSQDPEVRTEAGLLLKAMAKRLGS